MDVDWWCTFWASVAATINYTLQLQGGTGPSVEVLYGQAMEAVAPYLPLAVVQDSKRLKPRELFDQVIDRAVPQDPP